MVITVTLNPAIDKTVKLSNFEIGSLNRIKEVRKDAGGKGINVSKVVAELQGQTKALGFLAGSSGQFIADSLEMIGVKHNFTWLAGETRTNLKMIDLATDEETEINEPGPQVSAEDLAKLTDDLLNTVKTGDFVILTGSLPQGTPEDIYADLITKVKQKGGKVVLDTYGQPFLEGVKAKPSLVKPNIHELEKIVARPLESTSKVIEAAKEIHQSGVEIVVVSLGGEGSIVVSQNGVLKVNAPKVEVESTVGAGDTLVGALSLKLSQGVDLKEAIHFATAASANSVTKAGTQLCKQDEIDQLLDQITIEILE
jgi:1-phosphofructokinase